MSSFDEHVMNHRRPDGSYDLDAAEEDFRHVLENDPAALLRYAARTARQERRSWTDKETSALRKQLAQPALSPALELNAMVPLGDGTAVRFGDMNRARISARKDMRLRVHLDELRTFEAEMTFWRRAEALLEGDETIQDAIARADPDSPARRDPVEPDLAPRVATSGGPVIPSITKEVTS